MGTLSPDLVTIITIIIASLLTLLVYYLVLAYYFIGKPQILCPHVPDAEEAQAKSGGEWLKEGLAIKAKKVYRNGGLDVEIGVLRAKMLMRLFLMMIPVMFGVALAWSLIGVTEAGTARLGMSNVLAKDFEKKGRTDSKAIELRIRYLAVRFWVATVGSWFSVILSLYVCDKWDERIVAMIERCVRKRAPAHHYAVLVTDLDDDDNAESVHKFFDACLGEGAVRRVCTVTDLDENVVEPREDDEEPTLMKKVLLGASGPPQSVRGAVNKWAESLRAQERAEAIAAGAVDPEAEEKKDDDPESGVSTNTVADSRETTKEARERAEAARAKAAEREKEALELQKKAATQPKKEKRPSSALGSIKKLTGQGDEEDDDAPEPPKALIVVFDSLARCSVALSAQLRNAGATSGWKIRPLPEPRDLRWATLEAYPDKTTRMAKARTCRTLKIYLLIAWAFILTGLALAIIAVAEYLEKLSPAFSGLAAAATGFCAASLAATLLRAMAGILAVMNDLLETHVSESSLQRSVSRDYAAFVIIAGFITPLLGTTVLSSFRESSGNVFQLISMIAGQVPANAFTIMLTVLKLMFYPPNAACRPVWKSTIASMACRLDDEITRVALNYVFMVPKPVTEREKKIPAGPLLLFDMCGLDTFIMTIGLTYMPIQPVASFLCFWYFWSRGRWGVVPRKLQPQVYESQFDTEGSFQRIYAQQHMYAILVALVITFVVVAFSQAYIQLVVQLPLFFVWCHYNGKRVKRHQNSLHGASHSRLALEDAARLDAERAPAVKAWEQSLYEKGFWRAPEAIPEALDAKINSDAPAGQQLDELEGWLDRQKDHDAGDWPTGEFTGGKHDRHDSSDKV